MKEFDRFSFPRNYSGKVPLFFRKFPEKFRRKFPEISELTTLAGSQSVSPKFSALVELIVEIFAFTFVHSFFLVSCKIFKTRDTTVVTLSISIYSQNDLDNYDQIR